MSRVNTVPAGLQSLLGSTNFGDNPSELSEVLRPSLEQLPFLAAYAVRNETVLTGAATTGNFNRITVPLGEAWMILQAFAGNVSTLVIGQQGKHSIRVQMHNVDTDMTLAVGDHITGIALSETIGVTWQPRWPFLLLGGSEIEGHDEFIFPNGSDYNTRLSVNYYRFTL